MSVGVTINSLVRAHRFLFSCLFGNNRQARHSATDHCVYTHTHTQTHQDIHPNVRLEPLLDSIWLHPVTTTTSFFLFSLLSSPTVSKLRVWCVLWRMKQGEMDGKRRTDSTVRYGLFRLCPPFFFSSPPFVFRFVHSLQTHIPVMTIVIRQFVTSMMLATMIWFFPSKNDNVAPQRLRRSGHEGRTGFQQHIVGSTAIICRGLFLGAFIVRVLDQFVQCL